MKKIFLIFLFLIYNLIYVSPTLAIVEEEFYAPSFSISENSYAQFDQGIKEIWSKILTLFFAFLPLLGLTAICLLITSFFAIKTTSSAESIEGTRWTIARSLIVLIIIIILYSSKNF